MNSMTSSIFTEIPHKINTYWILLILQSA